MLNCSPMYSVVFLERFPHALAVPLLTFLTLQHIQAAACLYKHSLKQKCWFPSSSKLVALAVSTGLNWKVGQRQPKASSSFEICYPTIQLQRGTSQLSKHRISPFRSFILNTSRLRCWPFKFIISNYTWQVQVAVQLLSYTNTRWCSSRFYRHSSDPREQTQLLTVHPLLTKLSHQLGQPLAQRPVNLR